jgi:hypothetical protein
MSDGIYPYIICASNSSGSADYYHQVGTAPNSNPYPIDGKDSANQIPTIYASDKPVGNIVVARGPVYFTQLMVRPTQPKLVHSSETISIPVYEVQFSVTRTASIKVEIISTDGNMCMGSASPTTCRTLTIAGSGTTETIYDPLVLNKVYWDGKDEKGEYVKTGAYEFRFTANPYPMPASPATPTIRSEMVNVNNFQVFDRAVWDVTVQNNGMGKFGYQLSVPMKMAIQIFKPGTKIADMGTGQLLDPANPIVPWVSEDDIDRVLVKAIIGVRPPLDALEDPWDGTDYAGQKVPDGVYPYRYVTVLDSYDMDSINGHVKAPCYYDPNNPSLCPYNDSVQSKVADWKQFTNLDTINVATGDSWLADVDWKSDKVTMFYPNPLRASEGQFEITKVPAPGTVTIKIYNIAGDLVKDGGYMCYTARGDQKSLEQWNIEGLSPDMGTSVGAGLSGGVGGRNFALRCKWDRSNGSGKKVARGLYYAIMELNPTRGNAKKSQKVVKILIP